MRQFINIVENIEQKIKTASPGSADEVNEFIAGDSDLMGWILPNGQYMSKFGSHYQTAVSELADMLDVYEVDEKRLTIEDLLGRNGPKPESDYTDDLYNRVIRSGAIRVTIDGISDKFPIFDFHPHSLTKESKKTILDIVNSMIDVVKVTVDLSEDVRRSTVSAVEPKRLSAFLQKHISTN